MKKEQLDLLEISKNHPIILYDGNCILCSGAVQWIIKRDKKRIFRYCPLQSQHAQELEQLDLGEDKEIDTVYLLHSGHIYERSDVTFNILDVIGWPWKLLGVFKVVPKVIRDSIYNLIARNRYQWFGHQKQCLIPDPSIRDLFLSY